MVFQQNPLEKAHFICQMTGPASQFWQMESALSLCSQVLNQMS